jgi:outer membrane protein assembly factor BamA
LFLIFADYKHYAIKLWIRVLKPTKIKIIRFAFITLFILCAIGSARNADATSIEYNDLNPSKIGNGYYEIDEIKISGNKFLSNEEIFSILMSHETSRSPLHDIFNFYFDQILINPYSDVILPTQLPPSLKKFIDKWDEELPFFNLNLVIDDSVNLESYYNQNGFRLCKVDFRFYGDSASKSNILEFIIDENERSILSAFNYMGLDSLDKGTRDRITSLQKIRTERYYSEQSALNEINSVLRELSNSGYYYSRYKDLKVTINTETKKDSISVKFTPGKRQRIASIKFVDSLNGQNLVVDDLKRKQMEMKAGDWYNRRNLERSRDNLYSLGTFEVVYIDTTSHFEQMTDTTLSMVILTSYRKQQDWDFGLFVNRSTTSGYINTGIAGNYLHRNLGGAAQSVNPYAKVELQNINDLANVLNNILYEGGIKFAQPHIFDIDAARFGLSVNPKVSLEKLYQEMEVLTFSLPTKLPIKFPEFTFFQYASIDVLMEYQKPLNYDSVYANFMGSASSPDDSAFVENSLKYYETLHNNTKVPSALIVGGSLIGDKRDFPFNPTKGYFINFTIDSWVGIGIAKYHRFQGTYYNFQKLSGTTVLAIKGKIGGFFYKDEGDYYIPSEKQFFAGGANSVRGWASRRLRYPNPKTDTSLSANSQSNAYLLDYIGSALLIEGTAEIRWRMPKQRGMNQSIKEFIENIEVTSFIDIGNTFHWLADDQAIMNGWEYITGLGVSWGFGFGYMTPIGPFRLDLAIPVVYPGWAIDNTIFSVNNALKETKFHIGLGHSF